MGLGGAHSYASVTVVRFLLGVFEAGLFPGLVYYLTFWYTSSERSLRVAFILASATLAGAFGGAIAYGVGHMNQARDLSGWRWLFIIEGAPSCLSAVAVWLLLPDYPEDVKWLSENEKTLATQRLELEGSKGHDGGMTWADAKATLGDLRLWGHYIGRISATNKDWSIKLTNPKFTSEYQYLSVHCLYSRLPSQQDLVIRTFRLS